MYRMKKVAIVIVSYNGKYLQQANIESIRKTCKKGTYSIYVVDNASTDGVTEYLEAQEDVHLIKNTENVGFPKGCNMGVAATIGTEDEDADIFLLNNDTRLCERSLENLQKALYSADDIGMVGSCSNYAGNDQTVKIECSLPEEYVEYGNSINVDMEHPYEERVRLCGFAVLIRREVWDKCGGLDEDFTPGYFEDDDISMRISKLGYRILYVRNSFIYHAGSQSFSKREGTQEILMDHKRLFIEKYGFDIFAHYEPDRRYIVQLPFDEDAEFDLLQLGCGLCPDLKILRSRFSKARYAGIESDDRLYDIASGTEEVYRSIEELCENVTERRFNAVLADASIISSLPQELWDMLVSVCAEDCVLFTNEDGDMSFVDDEAPSPEEVDDAKKEANKMTDEEIKIKALNQAVNIAKLMSDVTTDDVIKIAGKVAKFIKG